MPRCLLNSLSPVLTTVPPTVKHKCTSLMNTHPIPSTWGELRESRQFQEQLSILIQRLRVYKNMVVGGHLPVTLEKAIYKYLSALQLHIEVGNWVVHCILQHRELDERVTAVHQFILIAKQCLEFNNYSSVMAVVVAGLGSAPIRRLHKTWEGVSKYHVDLFKEVDLLLESGDLTFICDGNPDYLRGGLINVHKRRQVYSKVEEIKRLQRDAYNFQPVLEMQNYFTQYRLTSDDELHSLAHELEPKMVVHRRAPRSRSSTNLSSTTPNFSFFKPNSKYLSTTTLRT
ncbi:hypothetical protein EMCRGX_G009237 [Ephydatia muelleri]